MSAYAKAFIKEASEINFPIHRSIQELSEEIPISSGMVQITVL